MTISVVIPAYGRQDLVDLALASLSKQTYPADLTEVVIVDDGSTPPISLPKIRPANCRIVRADESFGGWGPGFAWQVGVAQSTGEIILRLDADMVAFPQHVEAHARWHHITPCAVTIGYKRFVSNGWASSDEVAQRCGDGTIDRLFAHEMTAPHDYIEKIIDESDQLRTGHHLSFRVHVGATVAARRSLYELAGGPNPGLTHGEDTEFGYRLAQAGAVFIPEPRAASWHMGSSAMMEHLDRMQRHNQPYLADLMPHPRWLRRVAGRSWAVPLVVAVVLAEAAPFEMVRTCVDRILASDEHDLRVHVVAAWDRLTHERRAVLGDPLLDLRLTEANYRSDPRVVLSTEAPQTAFPSPYLLRVPVNLGVGEATVRNLVEEADRWRMGLIRVLPTGATSAAGSLELWRTAAVSRAVRCRRPEETLEDTVAAVYGERWVSGEDFRLTDLSSLGRDELVSPVPRKTPKPGATMVRKAQMRHDGVQVGGIRSLARATVYVAKLGVQRILQRKPLFDR